MTRQEIIDSLQTCRNAKCYDCKWDSKDYPVCMADFIDGITPYIIHELQRIDKILSFCERMASWHYTEGMKYNKNGCYAHMNKELQIKGAYERIIQELKGDDSHANPSQP